MKLLLVKLTNNLDYYGVQYTKTILSNFYFFKLNLSLYKRTRKMPITHFFDIFSEDLRFSTYKDIPENRFSFVEYK